MCSRLELGQRKQLRIDRAEWSKPMNDLLEPLLKSKKETIIKTTSDGSILYLNFASHTLNPNGTFGEAVLQVCISQCGKMRNSLPPKKYLIKLTL